MAGYLKRHIHTIHEGHKDKHCENVMIYINIEKTSEFENNANQVVIDPLSIPQNPKKDELNGNFQTPDPLDIPENPIKTEHYSAADQKLNNFLSFFDSFVVDTKYSTNLIESKQHSCITCGKKIDKDKLKTHQRFCAK